MLRKWVEQRMKQKLFFEHRPMDQNLGVTQDGESVIVGGYVN